MKKENVTRKQKREEKDNFKAMHELIRILQKYFPGLVPLLKGVQDPRNESYITYENQVILLTRILGTVFRITSMRKLTEEFTETIVVNNIGILSGIEELAELPHYDTINNYLAQLEQTELEKIIQKLVRRLLRMRTFEDSRIRNKYWQIVIDGTNTFWSNERHCPHCLTKEHKNEDGSIKYISYYHSTLEAKLVLNGIIVVSIGTCLPTGRQSSWKTRNRMQPSKTACQPAGGQKS
jgi:hypothetical protein